MGDAGKGPYKVSETEGRPSHVFAWRVAREMTQQTLARLASCSVGSISQIETGVREPSIMMLKDIAAALRVEPGWLLSRNPDDALDAWSMAEQFATLTDAQRRIVAQTVRMMAEVNAQQ